MANRSRRRIAGFVGVVAVFSNDSSLIVGHDENDIGCFRRRQSSIEQSMEMCGGEQNER